MSLTGIEPGTEVSTTSLPSLATIMEKVDVAMQTATETLGILQGLHSRLFDPHSDLGAETSEAVRPAVGAIENIDTRAQDLLSMCQMVRDAAGKLTSL